VGSGRGGGLMGLYTVLTPCVVGDLHYTRVPDHPVEADDTAAAALVAAGSLALYTDPDEKPTPAGAGESRSRRRSGSAED